MFNLKIWITKFRIKESQAVHGPRHVDLNLLFAFKRVAYMRALGSKASALQIVAQVPAAVATVLYAHVAQNGVEVERGHVKCLSHLSSRECILGRLVQELQRATNYRICTLHNLLAAKFAAAGIASWDVTASLANLWQHL